MTVSVIVPVHNGAPYVAEALDSALAQTSPPLEVVVMDDGSSDGTGSVLDRYGSGIVRLRSATPAGPARARNRAMAVAQGTLLAFLDADDVWHRQKLERQLALAAARPDFGLIATEVEFFDDRGRIACRRKRRRRALPQGWVLPQLLRNNWITTSAALARRAAVMEAGGFDEEPCRLGEDWMLWMRMAAAHPVYCTTEVLTRRRVHGDSFGHARPEVTFYDLLRHLERLGGELDYLQRHPERVRRAAYALCVYRGAQDVHALQPEAARSKLHLARQYGHGGRAALWTLLSYIPAVWLARAKRWKRVLGRRTGRVFSYSR
ncbi:MAG: glycosyltransferase family A protein [Terriglobales bacterium]